MSEKFLYLTTTGRVTGQPHKIEIWYVEHEGCFYLCAEHRQQSDWIKNIMHNPAVNFYIAQRGQQVDSKIGEASFIENDPELRVVKQKFDEKYKWSDGLMVRISKQ